MFGKDIWWWAIPTHPCLQLNYLEKLYTRPQLKQILRNNHQFEEDDWDVNKKYYLAEIKQSNKEKRIVFGILAIGLFFYFVSI